MVWFTEKWLHAFSPWSEICACHMPISHQVFFCCLLMGVMFNFAKSSEQDYSCSSDLEPYNERGFTMDVAPGVDWICCMCPKGTYMLFPCKYQQPNTRVCVSCLFTPGNSNEQYYSPNHSHNHTKCEKAIEKCNEGEQRIEGNASYPAECEKLPDQDQFPVDIPEKESGGWHIFLIIVLLLVIVVLLALLFIACCFPSFLDALKRAFCSCCEIGNEQSGYHQANSV